MGAPAADAPHPLLTPSLPRSRPPSFHESIGPSAIGMVNSSDDSSVSSIIHDEARVVAWDKVLSLCESHPEHAQYAGPDGWTALHHACNRRCDRYEVVRALITAYPQALMELEEKGMTPLHYACRFKAPFETVRLLLHLFPDIGKQSVGLRDIKGRTPLWYAVRYDAPNGVMEMLLEIDSSTILERDRSGGDRGGESPLSIVWDSWAEKFEGKRTLAPFLAPEGEPKSAEQVREKFDDLLAHNKKLKSKWETTNLFLKSHFGMKSNGSSSERKYRMLHATADRKSVV